MFSKIKLPASRRLKRECQIVPENARMGQMVPMGARWCQRRQRVPDGTRECQRVP